MKFPVPAVVLSLAWLVTSARAGQGWSEVGPLPRGLGGHAAASVDATVWAAGGSHWIDGKKRIEDGVYRRSGDAGAWKRVATLPHGYAHGGSAADATALWLAGGLGHHGPLASVQRIDLASGDSSEFVRLPEPRVYCGAAILDGELWIVGGTAVDGALAEASPVVWRVHLSSGGVVRESVAGPAWINPLVLPLRGELHVLPGGAWSAERKRLEPPAHAWIFSPAARQWKKRPLAAPLPRGLSGVTIDEQRALITGGVFLRDGAVQFSPAAWLYQAADGSLAPQPAMPAGRLGSAMARDTAGVLVLGGEDAARSRAATVWRLTLR